jgi:6-pyruvoyltetrahydropterin/6-carboxytetrahydropterin synthase
MWLMSLNGVTEYCNPSVENIAKEVSLAMMVLFQSYKNLKIHKVTIYETPNCSTICLRESISDTEAQNWMVNRYAEVNQYAVDKGMIEYDDRKIK